METSESKIVIVRDSSGSYFLMPKRTFIREGAKNPLLTVVEEIDSRP